MNAIEPAVCFHLIGSLDRIIHGCEPFQHWADSSTCDKALNVKAVTAALAGIVAEAVGGDSLGLHGCYQLEWIVARLIVSNDRRAVHDQILATLELHARLKSKQEQSMRIILFLLLATGTAYFVDANAESQLSNWKGQEVQSTPYGRITGAAEW
jgi:hypothetical protein